MMAPSWAKWKMTQEGNSDFWWISEKFIQMVKGGKPIEDKREYPDFALDEYKEGKYGVTLHPIIRRLENK